MSLARCRETAFCDEMLIEDGSSEKLDLGVKKRGCEENIMRCCWEGNVP